VQTAAREAGVTPAVLADIALAVSEATTNVVLHAYDASQPLETDTVDVGIRVCDQSFEITVCDHGGGLRARSDSPGAGLGLILIGRLTQQSTVASRSAGGTRVWMRFALPSVA
jgi:serine/threonine-protein kinase RsbW